MMVPYVYGVYETSCGFEVLVYVTKFVYIIDFDLLLPGCRLENSVSSIIYTSWTSL